VTQFTAPEPRSEELIKRVIAGQRDRAFVVSKVEANDVTRGAMARACEASLTRLGTNYLDLYLLHWPVSNDHFSDAVAGIRTPACGEQNSFLGRAEDRGQHRQAAGATKLTEATSPSAI
jgi:diketogulonate reductase-like aldo/keto reductase